MTLFERLDAAGVPTANHESDLYFPDTPQTRALLEDHVAERRLGDPEYELLLSRFRHQVERVAWFDAPFAYDPWWEARLCLA